MCASVPDGFGVDLINRIWSENPGVGTDEFGDEVVDLITEAVELEKTYSYEACPDEVLDMSAEQFTEYVEHIVDRRLGQLDLPDRRVSRRWRSTPPNCTHQSWTPISNYATWKSERHRTNFSRTQAAHILVLKLFQPR
jgi:ribonucleotide reductase beta subunit family protein with ferritin-like domain